MKALEIGPGLHPVNCGWDMMDMISRKGITYQHDIRIRPWPIESHKYDLIYMSHILEHIPWFDTVKTLREALRILRPLGEIEIWVPDFEKIVAAYLKKQSGDNWRRNNPNNNFMTWINGRIFTYGPGDENWHRAVFDESFLRAQLKEAGFRHTKRLTKPRGYDHGMINLGVAAVK